VLRFLLSWKPNASGSYFHIAVANPRLAGSMPDGSSGSSISFVPIFLATPFSARTIAFDWNSQNHKGMN
jgi:hypothetical protein